tara:strand:- start:16128 stop:16418 length:291 start_codon:yes stop_codon:yes gene_type:complete
MSYAKGDKVESGIWKLEGRRDYLVEVSYSDPDSGRRVRKRKTANRLDLARRWRDSIKTDGLRGEILKRPKRKPLRFSDYSQEYLEVWSRNEKKASS